MKRTLTLSLMLLAVASMLVGLGTYATFSDTASSSGNNFQAGTLNISAGTATWSSGELNMKPGDTKTLSLTLSSDGTLPLNYDITTALSGFLAGGTHPVIVTDVRVEGATASSDSLSAKGGANASDNIEIDVTMPADAGNEYKGQSGTLDVTFSATQQP